MRGSREPRAEHELRPIVKQGVQNSPTGLAKTVTTGRKALRLAALAQCTTRLDMPRARPARGAQAESNGAEESTRTFTVCYRQPSSWEEDAGRNTASRSTRREGSSPHRKLTIWSPSALRPYEGDFCLREQERGGADGERGCGGAEEAWASGVLGMMHCGTRGGGGMLSAATVASL